MCEGVSRRVKLGGGDWDLEALVRVGSFWRISEAWGVDELGGVNLGKGRCDRLEEVKKVCMHTH